MLAERDSAGSLDQSWNILFCHQKKILSNHLEEFKYQSLLFII